MVMAQLGSHITRCVVWNSLVLVTAVHTADDACCCLPVRHCAIFISRGHQLAWLGLFLYEGWSRDLPFLYPTWIGVRVKGSIPRLTLHRGWDHLLLNNLAWSCRENGSSSSGRSGWLCYHSKCSIGDSLVKISIAESVGWR